MKDAASSHKPTVDTTAIRHAQSWMAEHGVDAWLITDFRASSSSFPRLVPPLPGQRRWTTRRVAMVIPKVGPARLATSAIDEGQFPPAAYPELEITVFVAWQQWQAFVQSAAPAGATVAMDYSPNCALPVIAQADAGSVELVREAGLKVVSSADLMQAAISRWSPEAVAQHARASTEVAMVKDEAFALIRSRLASGTPILEHEAAEFILQRFSELGLESRDCPVVATNEHAADPHFEPTSKLPTPIKPGDWILMDLWARRPGLEHIFSDITWMAYAAGPGGKHAPTDAQMKVYHTVVAARDASLALAQQRWKERVPAYGHELDDAARNVIVSAGYQRGVKHRTGHSLSSGLLVHGTGMNLDNLETHDTRVMMAETGFTIEPGIYLASERIGVRSEINVYVDPAKGPTVTSCVQRELVMV